MERKKLFPEIQPYNSGMLKVSDLHTLYYEEVGNPKGEPILFLHGGPGGGLSDAYRRYDMDCRISAAWKLHKLLPKSKLEIIKDAGHSGMEPGTLSELVKATEDFKRLYE